MIEFCKTIAVNIFWVLAAITEVLFVTGVILGIIDRVLKTRHQREEGEE